MTFAPPPARDADLASLAAVDVAEAIRARRVTSEEVTRAAIERLHQVHARCNAVVTFEDDEALLKAQAADAAVIADVAQGPLHGVPVAHKDMFDRAGKIASWGARIHAVAPASRDATVIARLKAAGTIQIAALHLTEFAFGPTGHNYVLGHARNPWNIDHITGGSSSGSAIAVATGTVPVAFGSDTAGSLRLPAAACGILSLKSTWSRVSRAGCMPLSGLLDCVGPLARDMRDIALVARLIAGADGRDGLASRRPVPDYVAALSAPVQGIKIGVDEALIADAHPEVQRRLTTALAVLEQAGCIKVAVRFKRWREIDHLTQLLQLPEVASAHGAIMRTRGGDYGPQVRARVEYGHFISGADHQTAVRARGMILDEVLAETFGDCAAVLLPTFPDPVPTIAELDVAGGPTLMAAMARTILYTRPINYLALPALTMPYPHETGLLPNGFQLVGRPFGEARLMTLGAAYQRVVPPRIAPLV